LVTVAPTDGPALERPAVTLGCNECNEALKETRAALAAARRLAALCGRGSDCTYDWDCRPSCEPEGPQGAPTTPVLR